MHQFFPTLAQLKNIPGSGFPIHQAYATSLVVAITVFAFIEIILYLKLITSRTSRKLIHLLIGPFHLLTWSLYPIHIDSPWFSATIPFAFSVLFFLIGSGIVRFPLFVNLLSRSGRPQELLSGPLTYGLIHTFLNIFYWKSTYSTVIILALCIGDGIASLVGFSWGGQFYISTPYSLNGRLPWNKNKTWIGTLSFISFSILSFVFLHYFTHIYMSSFGRLMFPPGLFYYFSGYVVIAAFIESITDSEWDNLTIFLGCLFFLEWFHPFPSHVFPVSLPLFVLS